MSMTREEAIVQIYGLKKYCEDMADSDESGSYVFDLDVQALDLALSALRPVSREQVKRVWYRGSGWKYETKPSDDGGIMYSAVNTCMYCGSETPTGNFCYRCGIAQTDMGVDVIMERLEALKDGSTTD